MTDMTAVLGLAGALGAAAIGAVGGSLLQRSKSRQEAATASLQQVDAERERARLTEQLALETIASARTANRALLALIERGLQDTEAGRPMEISRLDDEVRTLELELFDTLHRLAVIRVALPPGPAAGNQGLFTDEVAERIKVVREQLLDAASGRSTQPLAISVQLARDTFRELDQYCRAATSFIIARPEGFSLTVDIARPEGFRLAIDEV
ncbi:hypothetical protein ABZV87_27605 [Streptomyces tendae]|uniref:hypothetical protein n=1 Tax=Streptomyces tendae TaxID=1932 RepID=UPI0033BF9970